MAVNLPTAAREWKPKGKALAIEKKRVVLARKEDSMVKEMYVHQTPRKECIAGIRKENVSPKETIGRY